MTRHARLQPVRQASDEPLLAVLVATCNRPGLLAQRSLTAIQRQSRRPDFVVVVDDSDPAQRPDNRNLVNDLRLHGARIVYLTNSRTQGASGAWNTGLEWLRRHAGDPSSVFVAVLDDDDEWEIDHLAVCMDAAMSKSLDMVASTITRLDGVAPRRTQIPPTILDAGLFLTGNPHIQGSNLFVRLSALLESGAFDEALLSCTDRDLCIRLADLGWVRYSALHKPTVRHHADAARPRLSSPTSDPKKRGLDRFWRKWHGRMTEAQRAACLDRSKRYFGWTPPTAPEAQSQGDGPLVPTREPTESERAHADDLVLVVGVISDDDHAAQFANLLDDLLRLQGFDQICCLDVVVLHNGGTNGSIAQLIGEYRARGLCLFLATERQQRADAGGEAFGAGFLRPEGRAPIGLARTMLQSYVTRVASRRPGAIAWILDDDSRLDNRSDRGDAPPFTTLLSSLNRMRSLGVDVVLGTVTGDPPIPPGSIVRTQLVDLCHNLGWLSRLDPESSLPDRRDENRTARAAARDYYYDLSRRDTHHLEWPFWITPADKCESVGSAFMRMVHALPRVLAGQGVFRPLLLDSPFDSIASIRPSVQRGTNTFVFDCTAFEDFPNLAPRFTGHMLRRSDMIWALLNRYAGGRRIVSATLPIQHDRSSEMPLGLDLERLVPDIRGYALYSALEDVLVRRRERRLRDGVGAEVPDDLRFRKGDLDLAEARFRKYLIERTAALLSGCWRIRGLCGVLSRIAEGTQLPDAFFHTDSMFADALRSIDRFAGQVRHQFAVDSVSRVVDGILDVPSDEVRAFLRGLRALVHQHRAAKRAAREDAWFQRERVASAEAIAQRIVPAESFRLLGTGGEGVVLAASQTVLKVIDYSKRSAANGAWSGMQALIQQAPTGDGIYQCDMPTAPAGRTVIRYLLEGGRPYRGGGAADIVGILRECRRLGIVTSNFHPKNLLVTPGGVRLIDYGSDIRPWSDAGFRSMVQRAWLTLNFHHREELAQIMRKALTDESIPELEGWESLLAAIDPPTKREVVDDLLLEVVRGLRPRRVLDFGCGHGRVAAALAADGVEVVAFDPDPGLSDHWCARASENDSPVTWVSGHTEDALREYAGEFDLVMCSQVLCVIEDEAEYATAMRLLARSLSPSGRFVILLCNPEAAMSGDSTLERRFVPSNATKEQTYSWTKQLPSGNRRTDVHRPIERVLTDLSGVGLFVDRATFTGGLSFATLLPSRDNLILTGSKAPASGPIGSMRLPHRLSVVRRPVDVPVLCYHRILPTDFSDGISEFQRRRGTVVDLSVFTQHLADLKRHFAPVWLDQYLEWLDGHIALPTNACLVTFDDGYRDFMEFALPALTELDIPCVLFPTMCAAQGHDLLPVDALYSALTLASQQGRLSTGDRDDWVTGEKKRQYVRGSREEQRCMLEEAGLPSSTLSAGDLYLTEMDLLRLPPDRVALGGHGERHELLAGRDLHSVRRELRRVRLWLEQLNRQRGDGISAMAYPNGSHDTVVVAATIEAGFHAAFSVAPWRTGRPTHRWALRRSCIPNRPEAIQELADGKEVRL